MSATKKTQKVHPLADLDIRLLERKLRKGEITRDEYEKMLASLPESEDYTELNENAPATAASKGPSGK